MTKGARIGLIIAAVIGVPLALACLFGAFLVSLTFLPVNMATTPDDPAAAPPLARLNIIREDGRVTEIHATLAAGYSVEGTVNLRLFDGFEPYKKPAVLEQSVGKPTGYWKVPARKAPRNEGTFGWSDGELAPYYDRPEGRVTLRPFPTPEQGTNWVPMAYPRDCTLEYLFPDARLRTQLANVLPAEGYASLNIHSSDRWGALIVSLNRSGCQDVELMSRR